MDIGDPGVEGGALGNDPLPIHPVELDVHGEGHVEVGEYGHHYAGQRPQRQTGGRATLRPVSAVVEQGGQNIGKAQDQIEDFPGEQGAAALKDQLENDLDHDDLDGSPRP